MRGVAAVSYAPTSASGRSSAAGTSKGRSSRTVRAGSRWAASVARCGASSSTRTSRSRTATSSRWDGTPASRTTRGTTRTCSRKDADRDRSLSRAVGGRVLLRRDAHPLRRARTAGAEGDARSWSGKRSSGPWTRSPPRRPARMYQEKVSATSSNRRDTRRSVRTSGSRRATSTGSATESGSRSTSDPISAARRQNKDRLAPGSLFTVEPGLYYPSRGIGIRIEDVVYARPDGTIREPDAGAVRPGGRPSVGRTSLRFPCREGAA